MVKIVIILLYIIVEIFVLFVLICIKIARFTVRLVGPLLAFNCLLRYQTIRGNNEHVSVLNVLQSVLKYKGLKVVY
jgi:hypothetical protein